MDLGLVAVGFLVVSGVTLWVLLGMFAKFLHTFSHRMEHMAGELEAAVAAVAVALDAGFADLEATIVSETAAVVAALSAAGVTAEQMASVSALGEKFSAGIAAAKTAIAAELPTPPTA